MILPAFNTYKAPFGDTVDKLFGGAGDSVITTDSKSPFPGIGTECHSGKICFDHDLNYHCRYLGELSRQRAIVTYSFAMEAIARL
ncbi:MAG: hypothetical protein R3D26_15365 [Cyanobacteriota/Melainabacteria group bacterium]